MTVKVITQENLRTQTIERRKQVAEQRMKDGKIQERTYVRMMESLDTGLIPHAQFAEGFDMNKHFRKGGGKGVVGEFIGTGNFAAAFYERQRYEVEAGRDEVPALYNQIYAVTVDASLPQTIAINTLGPAGVAFEQVVEGDEVKFASVAQGSKSVTLYHHAVGIQYSEDLFMYNELFRLANIDRRFGNAYNALLNEIHLSPILSATYGAANQTDGTALTTFKTSASMPEKYLRAIEGAISKGIQDTTNQRRGPYVLLVGSSDVFTVERALNRVPQQGFDVQSSAMGRVQSVVAYDGWTGTRGKRAVTYNGVAAGKGYLVDLGFRSEDFQSYFKHELRRQMGNGDASRFIMEETIWDVRLGAYAAPTKAVHEITWPLAGSGAA